MSDKTGIEWTDATWNPVTGCTKVSPGCDHCYAETLHERFHGKGSFATVTLHPERLELPLRWRKPRRVFVNSMSDLFHDDVPDEFIAEVFGVMATCAAHTFQVLTKRHARMRSLLSSDDFRQAVLDHQLEWMRKRPSREQNWPDTWPVPNVWLGVSVETQQWADIRIPALCLTPAAIRFLSCEPLLGPVDLALTADAPIFDRETGASGTKTMRRPIDWVIVGGESGPGARPMHPEWARSLRDQCIDAGVAFLFKQWGDWRYAIECSDLNVELAMEADGSIRQFAHRSVHAVRPDGTHSAEWIPEPGVTASMMRTGKKLAGRELDGRTWDEYPALIAASSS